MQFSVIKMDGLVILILKRALTCLGYWFRVPAKQLSNFNAEYYKQGFEF